MKHTKVRLELLNDIDHLLFLEKGIRGGVSTISNRYAKANNPYLPDSYEPLRPKTYIVYLDANNLYGWSMSEPLPTGNVRFVSDYRAFYNIRDIDCSGDTGYVLEVDLDYPDKLHDLHNDYPLAPESITVTEDMLSPTAARLREKLHKGGMGKVKKLIPNLRPKTNYVVHCRNLQLYVKLGLRITKIHRVMAFDQSRWLAQYINLNTELRKKAKNAFEKAFFKLMNNSVFGKTIEQLRKRIDVRIVTRVEPAEKLIAKPNYDSFVQINENVVAVKLRPTSITWNKPTYVGFCVLELAKLHMYDFHYNVVKARYGNEVKLLFTDTDSLCYFVQTDDVYADMFEQREYYDTVDYPPNHFLHSSQNAKVLGKFKDECAGNPPIEFVGLCAKMYSLLTAPDTHKFAVKGVKTSYAKKNYVTKLSWTVCGTT